MSATTINIQNSVLEARRKLASQTIKHVKDKLPLGNVTELLHSGKAVIGKVKRLLSNDTDFNALDKLTLDPKFSQNRVKQIINKTISMLKEFM